MNSLPPGWSVTKLSSICEIKGGKRLPKGETLIRENTGFPYIRVTDMDGRSVSLDDIRFLPPHLAHKLRNYRVNSGDLFIVVVGATIGKSGYVPQALDGAYLTENADRLTNIKIVKEYLLNVVQSEIVQGAIDGVTTQNAQPKLALTRLRDLEIPLPPIPEQRKIAAILSTWDEAITLTERLIEALRQRKQALMQLLLTGEVRFAEFEKKEWSEVQFGDIASRNGIQVNPVDYPDDLPCVELEHITQGTGRITGYTSLKAQKSIKNRFSAGQILFGKLRPYLRKFAQPDFDGVASSEIWVLNAKQELCSKDYLFYLVQSDTFSSAANVTSGTKMPRADWETVASTTFTIPDCDEQTKIVGFLNQSDQEQHLLEQLCEKLEIQKRGLMQQLLIGAIRVQVEEHTKY